MVVLDRAEVMHKSKLTRATRQITTMLFQCIKYIIIIEWVHATCNVAATVRCREG